MAQPNLFTSGEWHGFPVRFRKDQIIVSLDNTIPEQSIADAFATLVQLISGSELRSFRAGRRWAIIGLPEGADPVQVAIFVGTRHGIRYAEPDFVLYGRTSPDDTLYADGTQTWPDLINLPAAWELPPGEADVLLAVFDSGIPTDGDKFTHPDLSDPDHPLLSDADGRYIARHTDAAGVAVKHDYVDDDETPQDEHGHGTWTTGILAAMSDNNEGIAGVDWLSRVYIARVLNSIIDLPDPKVFTDTSGTVTYVSVVKLAMDDLLLYAIATGCNRLIVNMSFGSKDPDFLEEDYKAVAEHEMESLKEMCSETEVFKISETENGLCILCCAPGFYGLGSGAMADYPARFAASFDHVISVGSSDESDHIMLPSTTNEPWNEKEVTLLAPGSSSPCTTLRTGTYGAPDEDGTSLAAPMVAGVASLMWRKNTKLTPKQIKECLVNSGVSITERTRPYRRLDAGNAVKSANWSIALKTPTLAFVDMSEGTEADMAVVFSVVACATLTFVVDTEAMDAAFTVAVDSMTYDPATAAGEVTGITITCTAGAAGSTASGVITIKCSETGESWTVTLSANVVGYPGVAMVMVADKSGSMAQDSGIGADSRMDVVQWALGAAVETLRAGDACAIVKFDTDATLAHGSVDVTTDDPGDGEREPLYGSITALAPGGATSIGDGILLGAASVDGAAGRNPALLVVTDGYETAPEYITDVMDEIDVPVFAIGMGTAEMIQPEALEQLASGTGGYLLLTDTLEDENRFVVAKYCLQMLSQVSGNGLIVDPSGRVLPDRPIDIPFWVSGEDYSCDVIVLMPAKGIIRLELMLPAERRIDSTGRGALLLSGNHLTLLRLKVQEAGDAGRWTARLSVDGAAFQRYLEKVRGAERDRVKAHGVPYCALVSCRSGINMMVRALAGSHQPGSRVVVRSVITERGLPLRNPASVTAEIAFPDGTKSQCRLKRMDKGVNEYGFDAQLPGIYRCRVRAEGHTGHGERYQREQTVTAHIYSGTGGAARSAPPVRRPR